MDSRFHGNEGLASGHNWVVESFFVNSNLLD